MTQITSVNTPEDFVQEVAGAEFLAGVEAASLAGNMMEWIEAAAMIQGRALSAWAADWQQTSAMLVTSNPAAALLQHVGRRIEHVSAYLLDLQTLNDQTMKHVQEAHRALFRY